jgi:hypothetical protein
MPSAHITSFLMIMLLKIATIHSNQRSERTRTAKEKEAGRTAK